MMVRIVRTDWTLTGQWIKAPWPSLSSWAPLLGLLEKSQQALFDTSWRSFLTGRYWFADFWSFILILFFLLNWEMKILLCASDFPSLASLGLPVRIVRAGWGGGLWMATLQHPPARHISFPEPWGILSLGLLEDGLFSWQVVWPCGDSLCFLLGRSKAHSWMLS